MARKLSAKPEHCCRTSDRTASCRRPSRRAPGYHFHPATTPEHGDSRRSRRWPGSSPQSQNTAAGRQIGLLLADDHPVVRRGIISTLQQHPNMEIVGEAADGQEALRKARTLLPDVLLTDIDMPLMSGLAVTEALRQELPYIKVVILSMHTDRKS